MSDIKFQIPPSSEKDILKIVDGLGKHIDLKIEKRFMGDDGCWYINGITQEGKEMLLRFYRNDVQEVIDE